MKIFSEWHLTAGQNKLNRRFWREAVTHLSLEGDERADDERASGDRTDGEEVESRHACVGVRLEGASERDVDLGLLMVRSFESPHTS